MKKKKFSLERHHTWTIGARSMTIMRLKNANLDTEIMKFICRINIKIFFYILL